MKNTVKISIALLFGLLVLSGVSALAADTESPQGSSGDLFDLALAVSQTSSCPPGQDCSSPSYCSQNPGSPSCSGTTTGTSTTGSSICTTPPCNSYMRGQGSPAMLDADAFSGMEISGDRTYSPPTHQKKFVGLCCW